MKFLSKAICCLYCKTFHICSLLSHWVLSNCWTLSEIHFILPWSRSRTHFHHMLCFYTRSKQISIHPQNKNSMSMYDTALSQKYMKDMGLCKKKIKDAYPKKVCHMLRLVKKKRDKRCIPKKGMQHAYACQKKKR